MKRSFNIHFNILPKRLTTLQFVEIYIYFFLYMVLSAEIMTAEDYLKLAMV